MSTVNGLAAIRPKPSAPVSATILSQDPPAVAEEKATMAYTCNTCTRRKVKCDKALPICGTCRGSSLECTYQAQASRKRRRVARDNSQDRLKLYETFLKERGFLDTDGTLKATLADFQRGVAVSKASKTSDSAVDSSNSAPCGKLLADEGRTRYIESQVWQVLDGDGLAESSGEEDDKEPQEGVSSEAGFGSTPSGLDPLSGSLLSRSSPQSLTNLWPSEKIALKLFRVYEENIDPVCKLVHIPSGKALMQQAVSDRTKMTRAAEALLFAIFHFAVVSMTERQCKALFGQPQQATVSNLHHAVCRAFANAHFLRSSEVTVLQAYLLFLLSIRNTYDPHTFWILTGVAVRIGQRVGLYHDGEELGVNPFDTEIRRRIFAQLMPLDCLASQMCRTGIAFPKQFSTKKPLNTNDSDIWPGMPHPPQERTGPTDMTFCLARAHIGEFHRNTVFAVHLSQQDKLAGPVAKDAILDDVEDEVEKRFLRYCDPSVPIQALCLAMGRGAVAVGRMRIRLPRAKVLQEKLPEDERKKLWQLGKNIVRADIAARNNLTLKGFAWHFQAMFQWDAFIWILNEICRGSPVSQDEDIWEKIEQLYESGPQLMAKSRALHVALWKLTLRAWNAHLAVQGHEVAEPEFIQTLKSLVARRQSTRPSPQSGNIGLETPTVPVGDGIFTSDPTLTMDADFQGIDWTFWDDLMANPENVSEGDGLLA